MDECTPVSLLGSLLALTALVSSACNSPDSADATSAAAETTAGDEDPGTAGEPPPTTGAGTTGTADASSGGETTAATDPPGTTGAPQCGNGQLDEGEVCDDEELDGKQCADVVQGSTGTLACTLGCGAFNTAGCTDDPAAAHVVFNEVTSKGATEGPFAGKGDAIELYNVGGAPADLAGWRLSDDDSFPVDKTYVFPPGSALAPGAYLVLVELDALLGEGELPFGISSSAEETLALRDAGDAMVATLSVPGADAVVAYCRLPDGSGPWQMCDQTLGGLNLAVSKTCGNDLLEPGEACDGDDVGGQACSDVGFASGALTCTPACALETSMCLSSSPVAINELEATNDRIELHNTSMQPIDISGWILTDAPVDPAYDPAADLKKLVFPAATSLGAKQFLIVIKGVNPGQHPFGLSAEGDQVTLMKPDLSPISHVTYGLGEAGPSLCRLPDGPTGTLTVACTPTFGSANAAP